MKFATLTVLASTLSSALAFKDSSPFLFLSSNKQLDLASQNEITLTTNNAYQTINKALDNCPADAYILVHQPGIHSTDLKPSTVPFLLKSADSAETKLEKADLFHSNKELEENQQGLISNLKNQCNAQVINVDSETGAFETYIDTKPRIISIQFEPLSANEGDRKEEIQNNDGILQSVVASLPSPNYVLVYTSTPHDHLLNKNQKKAKHTGEPIDVDEPTVSGAALGDNSGNFTLAGDSLFENYSFFSPGIFMGLIVFILVTVVFLHSLTWISNLQVSYRGVEEKVKKSQ